MDFDTWMQAVHPNALNGGEMTPEEHNHILIMLLSGGCGGRYKNGVFEHCNQEMKGEFYKADDANTVAQHLLSKLKEGCKYAAAEAVQMLLDAGVNPEDLGPQSIRNNSVILKEFVRLCEAIKARDDQFKNWGWDNAISIENINGNTYCAIIPDGNGGYKCEIKEYPPVKCNLNLGKNKERLDINISDKIDLYKQKDAFINDKSNNSFLESLNLRQTQTNFFIK